MRKCFYAWAACCVACGSTNESRFLTGGAGGDTSGGGSIQVTTGTSTGTGTVTGAGGSGVVVPPDTRDAGGTKESGVIATLPPDFTRTEVGGFKLIGDLGSDGGTGDPSTGTDNCGNILNGVVRDFKGRTETGGNPDFQGPLYGNNITPGLVLAALGADQKPVYSGICEEGHATGAACPYQAETTTQANFDQWYRNTAGVNKPLLVSLFFAPQPSGLFRFSSLFFFPIDNAGWGNSGCTPDPNNCTANDGKMHNFSFTTELHTRFAYNGGETFTFQGDDDVWVFINGHLAVDVGGLHPPETQTVTLDTSASDLGIQKGNTYNLDLFHAERHTPQSTFTIDTNLAFVNCGIVLPPDIPR